MAKTLQVNFELAVSPDDYRAAADGLAQAFADVPGLVWKVWNLNEQTGEAGGFYLFADEQSLQRFAESELANQVKTAPILKNLSMKMYDVMEGPTRVTHAASLLGTAVPA